MIKAAIGKSEVSFRYIPFNGERYALSFPNNKSTISSNNRFASIDDVVDTLTVTATGYKTTSIVVTVLNHPGLVYRESCFILKDDIGLAVLWQIQLF